MMNKNTDQYDPVCGMSVDADIHSLTYDHIKYGFCSEQCLQRFNENPKLYIGVAGKLSVKQQGLSVDKRRVITLEKAPTPIQSALIIEHISSLMGIHRVTVDGNKLNVEYDLLQSTKAQIEEVIQNLDIGLGQSWSQKIRRSMINILEETQCSALESNVSTSKSCHK